MSIVRPTPWGRPSGWTRCATGRSFAPKERTVDLLHVKPGARLLDVGCGTGHDTRALAMSAGSDGIAVGVDASAVMLKTARTRGGSYLQADARALPYEDGAFD